MDHGFDGNAKRAGYVDVRTVRRMVELRERGAAAREIETTLGLVPGTAERLGRKGVLSLV